MNRGQVARLFRIGGQAEGGHARERRVVQRVAALDGIRDGRGYPDCQRLVAGRGCIRGSTQRWRG